MSTPTPPDPWDMLDSRGVAEDEPIFADAPTLLLTGDTITLDDLRDACRRRP